MIDKLIYKNQYKKYNYSDLEYEAFKQGSCYVPGRVYKNKDKLLLCVKKSGDCFYDFVEIKYNTHTSWTGKITYQIHNYYDVIGKTSTYGGMKQAFPKMETLSAIDLVHVLIQEKVLIPRIVTLKGKDYINFVKQIKLI